MTTDNQPIEVKVDAMIATLTADPASEEEQRSAEHLQETWRGVREMITNFELRMLLLAEARKLRAESRGEGSAL
jgi:hypothetical protein